MKKVLSIAAVVCVFTSCESQQTTTTTANGDTVATTTEVTTTMPAMAFAPAEGDVMMKDGSLMIWRNGAWAKADTDVTLENGVIVTRQGQVRRDTEYVDLEEGESVNRSGNFFDKTGNVIEDGWQGAKKGVVKAGEGVAKGAEKAGEAVGKGASKAWDATKKGASKVGEAAKSVVD